MKQDKKLNVYYNQGYKAVLKVSILFIFFSNYCCAQIYVNGPMSGTPAAGSYYNNNSIVVVHDFSFTASPGQSLQLYIQSDCVPLTINPTQNQNYILTSSPRIGGITSTAGLANQGTCQLEQTIQYFDGLGRPLQTVQVNGSPRGNDLVQPFAFDQFGRQSTKYLPYALTGSAVSDGSYKADALTPGAGQAAFYASPPNTITTFNTPRAVTAFEFSPLNRVIEQGAPGDPWQLTGTNNASGVPSGHTVKIVYASNDGTQYWAGQYSVSIDGNMNRTLIYNGSYGANQLYVTVSKDENWTSGQSYPQLNTTEEYKDKDGHIILKRTYNYTTSLQVLSTYYVYDDIGNLCYVLPPQANADAGINSANNQTTLNSLCYQYGYDYKNRMIIKQLPGKGVEEIVYNLLDQVVYSRDASQAGRQEWSFTKYDAVGRVIMTGIERSNSVARATLQSNVTTGLTAGGMAEWETATPGSGIQGYSNNTYPNSTNIIPLTVNYYDDYSFTGQPSTFTAPTGASNMTKGLVTATKTTVLNTIYNTTPDMLWTVHYYNDLGRLTQAYAQHYLGGALNPSNYDLFNNAYDFTNEITATTRQHFNTTSTNPVVILTNTFVYDHMGRKKQTFEQISGGINVLLSQSDYNELGQVMTKHLHSNDNGSTFLQDINYTYNERGWLTKINDPSVTPASTQLFAEQLNYNLPQYGATPQYNGNIAEQDYNGQVSGRQHVTYTYDPLNRLTAGNSTASFSETGISYDLNGNIQTLTRANYGTLTYSNTGNQLTTLTGFKAGTNTYDSNGNLQTDGSRGATVSYNMLDLPQTITATNVNLTYTYDATGNKLRKLSNGTPTDYISGIQYRADEATIDFIQTEEGRAINSGGTYKYEYTLTDHLGNNRVTFYETTGHVGEDDYYPFGLNVHLQQNAGNKYLYNKKELQDELTEYDYGARFYDPVIGRFTIQDRFAEKYQSNTPYHYGLNNPVANIDLHGDSTIRGAGFLRNTWEGVKDGAASSKDFFKSLGTLQGWSNLAEGLGNLSPTNFVGQMRVGQSVYDGISNIPNMTTDDWGHATGFGLEKFGEAALFSKGAGLVTNIVRNGVTTSEGFLLGSLKFKIPMDINVGLYASENTIARGSFQFSTIAPESLANTKSFGRNMLQITEQFQPTLGIWTKQTIPKGFEVQIGLVGPQKGTGFGTWLQIYTPKPVPFVKP